MRQQIDAGEPILGEGSSAREAEHDLLFKMPSAARVTDALRAGKANLLVDRALCEELVETAPLLPQAAKALRHQAIRATKYAARRGITQFLDLGCGLPYPGLDRRLRNQVPTVFAYARRASAHPDEVRVTYVDNDPMVIGYANALLDEHRNVRVLQADILAMQELLASEKVGGHLDPSRPVAVNLHAVLHWIADDAALHQALAELTSWLAPGSTVSISHAASDQDSDTAARLMDHCQTSNLPFRARSREEIQDLFASLVLLKPGLVDVAAWRPEHATRPLGAWAGVAVKSAPGGLLSGAPPACPS